MQTPFALCRRWHHKPLALLLAILVSPLIPTLDTNPHPLAANAQVSLCEGTGSSIIRNYCVDGNSFAVGAVELERQAVEAVLAMHGMDASHAPVVYSVGRRDLRNQVRGMMHTIVMNIIAKTPADRTAQERIIYSWMQNLIQRYEIRMYEATLTHFNLLRNNPCRFQFDEGLRTAFGMEKWNSASFCFGNGLSSIFAPPVPNAAYFKSYGLKKSYLARTDLEDPSFDASYADIYQDTSLSQGEILGLGFAVGAYVAANVGMGIGLAVGAAYGAYTLGLAATPATIAGGSAAAGYFVNGSLVAAASGAGTGLAIGGSVAIVLASVAAMFIGGYMLYEDQRQIRDILEFTNQLAAARAELPDLSTFANDGSGQGVLKLLNALVSQTTPDVPGTAPMPSRLSGDSYFLITPRTGSPTYATSFQYLDWDKNIRTVQTSGRWLVSTCAKGPNSAIECKQPESLSSVLRFEHADGRKLSAIRTNDFFTVAKASPASTDVPCPIDDRALVSIASDFTKCLSYVTKSLEMKDQNGNPITVAFTKVGPPVFDDPGPLSFGIGVPATKFITASANPPARICVLAGSNANFSLPTCANGPYPVGFNGATNAPAGTFNVTLIANNEFGIATRTFPITVETQLAIVSSLNCSAAWGCLLPLGQYGQSVNYRVVATGNPTPRLSLDTSGSDFTGLTFTDNGDGTGNLRGRLLGSPLAGGTCGELLNPPCGGFIASNSTQGFVTQRIRLGISTAPQAELDGRAPFIYTFPAGRRTSLTLRAARATTQVAWQIPNLPSWLTMRDNGDNTLFLQGTAPLNAPEYTTLQVGMTPAGSLLTVRSINLFTPRPPSFTTSDAATFRVGTLGTFRPTVSDGSITYLGTLPQGLTFTPGNPATISGTPAPGSAGIYPLTLSALSEGGRSLQTLVLTVNEPPSIISSNLMVAFAGRPTTFDAIAYGHPLLGITTATASTPFSNDPDQGMQFQISGLPSSLQASSRNIANRNTGTLRISGTPTNADIGTRRVTITASNTIGNPVTQTLTLQVLPYNPVAPVSLVTLWTLSRAASGEVVARITVANNGSQTAENVALTNARIGTNTGTVQPTQIEAIPAGTTATFTIAFPASTGAAGTGNVLNLSGTYRGGTFNNAGRIVLP
jgi:hypothetical protein